MIVLLETTIQNMLNSSDENELRAILDDSLKKLEDHGTHPFIVLRFVNKLKYSLIELMPASTGKSESENIMQALKVLQWHNFKKHN